MLFRALGPATASLSHERRSAVQIAWTSGVRTVRLTDPELPHSRALVLATPAVADLSYGRPHIQLPHPMTNGSSWRGMGEVCPQGSAAAAQGGRIAGHRAYDVTDSKFSTSSGPPSCSPPV
jgi:hypothetical protein